MPVLEPVVLDSQSLVVPVPPLDSKQYRSSRPDDDAHNRVVMPSDPELELT